MNDIDPSARMQKRNVGELMHPACCAVCGNGTCEAGYVDIGVFYDYEGQVYLCMFCVNQVAETAGLLTDSQSNYLTVLSTELAQNNEHLIHELKVANERLAHYDSLFKSTFDGIIADVDDPESEDESSDGEPTDDDVNDTEPEQPVITEPVEVTGRSDTNGLEQRNGFNGIDL